MGASEIFVVMVALVALVSPPDDDDDNDEEDRFPVRTYLTEFMRNPYFHGTKREAVNPTARKIDIAVVAPRGSARDFLFFDGGSRGNPGPGGSGSVVIRVGEGVVGQAKAYMGLLVGLKECDRRTWTPLHIVGDSNIIIHQQATRTSPRAKHLRPLYWQCLRLADKLGVMSWQHHLRVYNKMADALVNLAMDSRQSVQQGLTRGASSTSKWDKIFNHAASDDGHWPERNDLESPRGSRPRHFNI
ncbi:hypothetical protein ON010_g1559 [Phytophthora cinnamomi]|nr:hypothetical protein ON010_g1559 [Phytophthora cinnamomi]